MYPWPKDNTRLWSIRTWPPECSPLSPSVALRPRHLTSRQDAWPPWWSNNIEIQLEPYWPSRKRSYHGDKSGPCRRSWRSVGWPCFHDSQDATGIEQLRIHSTEWEVFLSRATLYCSMACFPSTPLSALTHGKLLSKRILLLSSVSMSMRSCPTVSRFSLSYSSRDQKRKLDRGRNDLRSHGLPSGRDTSASGY